MSNVSSPDGISREPVLVRVPVTQTYLAQAVGHPEKCDRPNCNCSIPREHHFEEALYTSMAALVHMFAEKYKVSCRDDVEDLEQECFKRFFKALPQFDPKKGALSTWTWRICTSVLNSNYRKSKRHMSRQVDIEDESLENVGATVEPRSGQSDMVEALRALFNQHGDRSALLEALFGDPYDDEFEIPRDVCVSQAAREAGTPYDDAYGFYTRVVRPFFRGWFAEGGDDDE
jgi:RNA polymerase sigma factor (sigma-70 family)